MKVYNQVKFKFTVIHFLCEIVAFALITDEKIIVDY